MKPNGVRANSWQDVADLSDSLGIRLDAWQELILEAAMGERSDRTWAAKRVGISVPRQNGKSQLMVARILAGALLFGEKKIVVSAHQQDTARESFSKLMEIIEDDANSALRERLDPRFGRHGVMNAINREAVKFANGALIQFKARSGAAGKGFSSDCLLLDEAQILGSRAWTSINSTMSAMRNPQAWLLGTPPQEEDDCYTFEMVRRSAIEGKSSAAAWCEWSADTASTEYRAAQSDLAERNWSAEVEYLCWTSNPAWNARINQEVVQGEHETYTPERFAEDRLGIWRADQVPRVIPADTWDALKADGPPNGMAPTALAVDMSHERVLAIAACWRTGDTAHIELMAMDVVTDPLEAVEWLALNAGARIPVVIDSASPAAALVPALTQRRVNVVQSTASDMGKACGLLYDDAIAGRLSHAAQDQLDHALAGATKRAIRDAGSWGWDRKRPDVNIAPLVAATLALFGSTLQPVGRTPGRGRVIVFD